MATEIQRAKSLIDALLNKDVANAQILRVTTAISKYYENEFNELVADPLNPTNTELASFFVKKFRDYGKEIVKGQARAEAIQSQTTAFTDAENTAGADLE